MRGKLMATVHGSPHGRKTYIQRVSSWFRKGVIYDSAVTTPVQCSLLHDAFYLGLGGPKLH